MSSVQVALCSSKGSPGVTTLACMLGAVWPQGRDVAIAECDPAGGDLAARFGLSARTGMTSLVLGSRGATTQELSKHDWPRSELDQHCQRLPGGLELLAGPPGAGAATALDSELAGVGLQAIPPGVDLLVDLGRLGSWSAASNGAPTFPGQKRLALGCHRLVLVIWGDRSGVAHARWAAEQLATESLDVVAVVRGANNRRAGEISPLIGLPVWGVVPDDPLAAAVARGEPARARSFSRSPLVRFAEGLCKRLLAPSSAGRGLRYPEPDSGSIGLVDSPVNGSQPDGWTWRGEAS